MHAGRKSTRSGDNGGACFEVADSLTGIVAVSVEFPGAGNYAVHHKFYPDTWPNPRFVNIRCRPGSNTRSQTVDADTLHPLRASAKS